MKYQRFTAGLSAAVFLALLLLSGCALNDWWHDLRYGENPPPDTPIAPVADPMPGDYSEKDAAAFLTDSLIFTLSNLSGTGKPFLLPAGKHDALALQICESLRRSRVTASAPPQDGNTDRIFLLFSSRPGKDLWNLTLESADRKKTFFNRTVKLKETTR